MKPLFADSEVIMLMLAIILLSMVVAITSVNVRTGSGETYNGANHNDFPYTVESGATTTIGINMQAPSSPGMYSETWMIASGATTICQFHFSVNEE